MSRHWSSLRASLNQHADDVSARWMRWYRRRRFVGKLPQLAYYLFCLAIAWWIGGLRLAVIVLLLSLAAGLAVVAVGLVVFVVLRWRRMRR